jgi:hypothetical protein
MNCDAHFVQDGKRKRTLMANSFWTVIEKLKIAFIVPAPSVNWIGIATKRCDGLSKDGDRDLIEKLQRTIQRKNAGRFNAKTFTIFAKSSSKIYNFDNFVSWNLHFLQNRHLKLTILAFSTILQLCHLKITISQAQIWNFTYTNSAFALQS